MMGNSDRSMQRYNVANLVEGGQFNIMPHATLCIVSPQLTTPTNIRPQGDRDILNKIIVTAGPNELMFEQDVNTDDHVDVSETALRRINFRLTDIYGSTVSLHWQRWSFTLLFKPF